MKKNLRIVSAAAAALLAVAPVAASAVSANAAVVLPGGDLATDHEAIKSNVPTFTFKSSLNNVNANTKVSDLTSDDNILKQLSITSNDGTKPSVVGISKAVVSDQRNGGNVQDTLKAGNKYYLQAWVTVAGLKKSTWYAQNNFAFDSASEHNFGTAEKPENHQGQESTNQGTYTNVKIVVEFNAVDPNAKGTPFFAGNKVENGKVVASSNLNAYSDGQTVPAPTKKDDGTNLPKPVNVKDIEIIAKALNISAFRDSSDTTNRLTGDNSVNSQILAQLKADKLVDASATESSSAAVKLPANGWTLKLSYTNPINGKTATLNVVFNGDKEAQYSVYPLIKSDVNKISSVFANVKQGENNFDNAMGMVNVPVGTKDWAKKVISHFNAQQSTANKSYLRLTTDNLSSSDLNTTKPGLYNATLTATNVDGYKTTLNFNVAVTGSVKDLVETKTVLGSNNEVVRLVSLVDNDTKVSYLSGKVVNQGQSISVYTNDTKTVDGVSYTRVAKEGVNRENNNEWIPTENVVESKKTQKTVLHAAYEYDANHKRVGTKVLGAYNEVTVVGDKTQLADGTPAYKLSNGNYIDARNVDPTAKTLTHNAYIYKSNGKAYTYKKTVKKGKKHVKKTYHKVIKKGTSKDVWGGKFKKVGKLTNVYRIGKNQYVKAGNFGE